MPVVGKLDPFDPSTSEWAEYRERAELYFIANDIPSDKQTAVFLTCCGPETYSLLRGLLAPSRPAQAGLTEIFTTLGKHYAPRVSEVVASFKFFSRHRKEGETVSDYIALLKKSAEDCNFATFRERMLRDQIVSGINDVTMQTRLLETTCLPSKRFTHIELSASTATISRSCGASECCHLGEK
ncbi:hypothetical protein MRX96_029618 [Rhipicephalus microplus]